MVANATFGETVHQVFHQIPPHRQKQDHHGEGVDVQSHSLIGTSKLSSCSMKLLMWPLNVGGDLESVAWRKSFHS